MSGAVNGPERPERLVGALHDREPDPPRPARRLRLYIERRDAWIGCYVANDAVYVCPLPFVVIRWSRS